MMAVAEIIRYLTEERQDSEVQALHEAILSANRVIMERASAKPELSGMGSTCVIMLVNKVGEAYLAHGGQFDLWL